MSNPLNGGTLVGRVSQDIKEFPNNDGSKVLLTTLAVDDNFVSGTGDDRKAQTQFIPVRIFLAKTVTGRGAWDRVHTGDLIAIETRIACQPYQKDGQTVFPSPTIEVDGFPQFLEPKSVTDARQARKAVEAPAAPAVAETPEQTIARLQAEIAASGAPATNYDNTSPFPTA
ncbi:Single-stranded DNA-binding protein [Plantibacter flavus]|uniref:Single-stranded DNA-binding protein n=1 Tax=Plantibacter flavus TaxID=150123 RepID=A0A3N2BLF7_9MICO|nr:single-stranded DNA-binding protein [Plantibacter flavus]ROR76100.1 single-stranded DNA-binding protein [Plantibacter flavus]SMG48546.1 Single-stranded DNA-binding protein [Plantibacter flavus]